MVRQWICILGIATITTSTLAEEPAQAGNFLDVKSTWVAVSQRRPSAGNF